MKILTILFLLVSLSFAQNLLWENGTDSVSVDSGTAVVSNVIEFNAHPEGVATLFLAADSTEADGARKGAIGEFQVYYGQSEAGDSLFGQYTAFTDSVLQDSDLAGGAYDSGTMTGRETDLGSVWTLGKGVRFRVTPHFTGTLVGLLFYY